MALSGLSVLNRNNVCTQCASLHLSLQDLSNGFAFLTLIKYSIFLTTDEFKLLTGQMAWPWAVWPKAY